MKKKIYCNNLYLNLEGLHFYFFKYMNILLIRFKLGIIKIYLPNHYYYYLKDNNNDLKFLFLNKFKFVTLIKYIKFFLTFFFKFFFFKLKLKGLGYVVKKVTNKILRFFFAYNHFYYLYIPNYIYIWEKNNLFIILSNDKVKINNFFKQMLLLKKMDFYERTKTFIIPNKIIYLKK